MKQVRSVEREDNAHPPCPARPGGGLGYVRGWYFMAGINGVYGLSVRWGLCSVGGSWVTKAKRAPGVHTARGPGLQALKGGARYPAIGAVGAGVGRVASGSVSASGQGGNGWEAPAG